jgi:REP element-mobilizing transposase RayT
LKDNLPQRKIIRLKQYDYNSTGYYFITFCIKDRLNLLGAIVDSKLKLSKEGIIVEKYILSIQEVYNNVQIDEFVIMPNHIHIIIVINTKEDTKLSQILQQLKGKITKELGYSIWQTRFHDHVIRNEKEYYCIKQYIQNNIMNWKDDRYFS